MKKYGKYEKRPEGVPEKQPKVKSMLLQTYFTSLLCLVLCVTMFFGTSYAWFTSEVNNEGNEIYIGTLDVDLQDEAGKSLAGSYNPLFDNTIRWEPGYTALETIKVVNEGNLAFKYVLNFTDGKIDGVTSDELAEIASNFVVYVYEGTLNQKPADFKAIAEGSSWKAVMNGDQIATLADILTKNIPVITGNITDVRTTESTATDAATAAASGPDDSKNTENTYIIALHMNEDAKDPELMGHKIQLNVKLVAYQMGSEEDSFGNSKYDTATFVSSAEELQAALDNATGETTIVLGDDITGDVTVTQKPDVKITIDGDDHKFNGIITVNGKSSSYENTALTIKKVIFEGQVQGADAYIKLGASGDTNTRYTNHVTVQDCIFDGTDKEVAAVKSYTGGDKNLTITGCTVGGEMHSLAQLKNVEQNLIVTNCKVYSKNGLNVNNGNNLTMSGCTFDVQGYAVRFGSDDNTTDESFTIANSTLKSACAEAGDAVIEFRAGAVNATLTLTNTTLDGTTLYKGKTDATTINVN